jgi:hypothetical protein
MSAERTSTNTNYIDEIHGINALPSEAIQVVRDIINRESNFSNPDLSPTSLLARIICVPSPNLGELDILSQNVIKETKIQAIKMLITDGGDIHQIVIDKTTVFDVMSSFYPDLIIQIVKDGFIQPDKVQEFISKHSKAEDVEKDMIAQLQAYVDSIQVHVASSSTTPTETTTSGDVYPVEVTEDDAEAPESTAQNVQPVAQEVEQLVILGSGSEVMIEF